MNFFQEIKIALENTFLFSIFFFILGACLASFFNVVIFRYPKMLDNENSQDIIEWLNDKKIIVPNELSIFKNDINLSFPSSHCYSCKNPLKWYHNIPILSYILLKGKCGFCKTPYSIQYPIVEFFGGIILLVSYLSFFPTLGLEGFIFSSLFFMISYLLLLIDMKTMFLPDTLTYVLLWIGIIGILFKVNIFNITLNESLFGVIFSYLLLYTISFVGKKIKGIEVIGGGDLKLLAAIGAFIGIKGAIFTLFASPFIGILSWIYIKVIKQENPQFPYGPALITTSWIYIFYSKEIFKYLNLPF